MRKIFPVIFLVCLFSTTVQAQQLSIPSPSPLQTVKQDFGLSYISLAYSRPSIKGRTIFGDLVPYGKVWRTGANGATIIEFGDPVIINGKRIAAGKYGLLTIPGKDQWIFIISKQQDVTNPANYKEEQDVLRITAPVDNLDFSVETLTLYLGNMTPRSCELQLLWSHVAVKFDIQNDLDSTIMARIDETMNKDNRPYYAAAMYYMENGKDLNKALEWFNKATVKDPDAYFMFYQKARCEAKLGKKQDALVTAQKSIELAKKANNSDYVSLNEKLIASLK
ncbi:MAG: DUF2911 domain-containing protein [Chitinophagales bacterium]